VGRKGRRRRRKIELVVDEGGRGERGEDFIGEGGGAKEASGKGRWNMSGTKATLAVGVVGVAIAVAYLTGWN